MNKRKYVVTWVRISHLAEDIEVMAENEKEAQKLARQRFTGGEEVYAEEFCNGIECEEEEAEENENDK